jgi:hypothetical protein
MSNRKKNRSELLKTLAKNRQKAYLRARLAFERDDRRKWIIPRRTWPEEHLYEVVYLDMSLPMHEQRKTFRYETSSRWSIQHIFEGFALDKLNEEDVELQLVSITLIPISHDQ